MNSTGINLHCRLFTGNCGLNATVGVPPGTPLDLDSGGGNMQIGGIQSTVTLTSSGGDVSLSGSRSAATVDSGGGNLSVSDLGGILKFTTSGGDVDGGDLTSPNVTTDTGGGNVTLTFTKVRRPTSSIISSGGDVTIVLPHGATQYAIKVDSSGGDYSPSSSVPTNLAAATTRSSWTAAAAMSASLSRSHRQRINEHVHVRDAERGRDRDVEHSGGLVRRRGPRLPPRPVRWSRSGPGWRRSGSSW